MHLDFGKFGSLATKALIALVTNVPIVEAAANAFKSGTGAQKQAAVLDIVKTELSAAELLTGKDLANDEDVLAAAAAITDAVVAFHKIVASKVAHPAT